MPQYHHNANVYRQLRRWRRAHRVLMVPLFIIVLVSVGGGVYIWQQISGETDTPQTKQVSLGYYAGVPKKQYSNEVFSFTSGKEWLFIREASNSQGKFVFYNHLNGITKYELKVFVNSVSEMEKPVNFIQPINVKNGSLEPDSMSPKCEPPSTKNPPKRSFMGVSYLCRDESSSEVIGAGIAGGSYEIPLYNSQGTLQKVSLFFTDHNQSFQPEIFQEIIREFRLK